MRLGSQSTLSRYDLRLAVVSVAACCINVLRGISSIVDRAGVPDSLISGTEEISKI